MRGKSPSQSELNLFEPVLRQVARADHPLRILADTFPWNDIEADYAPLYSDKGAPAKPVRLMVGLLILKRVFNGSDLGTVREWQNDPYFQYLCGGNVFIGKPPCDPSDLARFRKRIGGSRLRKLMDLTEKHLELTGVNKLKIAMNTRPGYEGFSYSAETGFYFRLINSFRSIAGKFSRSASGPARSPGHQFRQ
jgi:hypothetical protein